MLHCNPVIIDAIFSGLSQWVNSSPELSVGGGRYSIAINYIVIISLVPGPTSLK